MVGIELIANLDVDKGLDFYDMIVRLLLESLLGFDIVTPKSKQLGLICCFLLVGFCKKMYF